MKDCNSCGKCCIKYSNGGLSASASEVEYWDIFRPKIAAFVGDGEIWVSPDDGQPLTLCPWLKKSPDGKAYLCEIYFDRPDDCKYYPVMVEEMIADGCEMIEVRDLRNLKQAQKTLDELMIDSRPPVA